MEVNEKLKENNITATILHMHTIKPFDKDKLIKLAKKSDVIFSIEEHTIIGGLGSACAEVILEAGFQNPKKFKRIGIPDTFPLGYGRQNDMMKRQNITVEHVLKSIKSIVG